MAHGGSKKKGGIIIKTKVTTSRILFILISTITTLFLFVGCGNIEERTPVDAVIKKMNYVPSSSYVTFMSTGKTAMPVTHYRSEEFNVTVVYEGMSLIINSEAIYNSMEIGESIKVCKVDVYKKDGTYKKSYLESL